MAVAVQRGPAGLGSGSSISAEAQIEESYGQLPLAFERNRGQTDGRVDFLARASGQTAFLTSTGATLALQPSGEKAKGAALRLGLTGADPAARPVAERPLPGTVNVLRGDDPANWITGAKTFARVRYHDVYPGIDLAWYGTQAGRLEFDFVVRPGAEPSAIGLEIEGARRISLSDSGALRIRTAGGTLVQRPPLAYQWIGGERRRVESRYELSGRHVRVAVGGYDRERPLVIDPVLAYSTYLGGASEDGGQGIAVDAAGNAYITGGTSSVDFPTTVGAFDTTLDGGSDAFVTKLNTTGSALVYSTYLGGTSFDGANSIAVDVAGNAYVAGVTTSTDFPTTALAFDTTFNGATDAFVTKLNTNGSALLYSTYLGGTANDDGRGIGIDGLGNAYLTGDTASGDFPTTAGASDTTANGGDDAYVTKLNSAGSAVVYSTYLGGASSDAGTGIALDAAGNAYVAGFTTSTDFPTTAGAFDTTANGATDAFVTKLNTTGSALLYSTYLGGTSADQSLFGVAVDAAGDAYLTGFTQSANFPTTAGAFDTTLGGIQDAFVTKLDPTGSSLVYSTYLGGSDSDLGRGLAIDPAGNAYVAGFTNSANFPTTAGAFDTTANGGGDAYFTKLNTTGSALVYSTYLGGASGDTGLGIAVDAAGSAYLTGETGSTDFPTTPGAFDRTANGAGDAFVSKFGAGPGPAATLTLAPPAATNDVGTQHCVTATVKDAAGNPTPGITVRFSVSGSVTTSGSATTDANGQAVFCYTGPELPGADAITAFADTDGDNMQDVGEPADAATKVWILPVSTPLCEADITKGGRITANNGDRATFGGNARSDAAGRVKGQEEYQDHGPAQPQNVKSIEILALTCNQQRTQATIFGRATINRTGPHLFRIDVQDLGEPGSGIDTYRILLDTGYDSGQHTLEGGNVQIH
jgi:hypothetical protein